MSMHTQLPEVTSFYVTEIGFESRSLAFQVWLCGAYIWDEGMVNTDMIPSSEAVE